MQELGSRILFATDDWFAAAENLLESSEPVWKEGFTDQVYKEKLHGLNKTKEYSRYCNYGNYSRYCNYGNYSFEVIQVNQENRNWLNKNSTVYTARKFIFFLFFYLMTLMLSSMWLNLFDHLNLQYLTKLVSEIVVLASSVTYSEIRQKFTNSVLQSSAWSTVDILPVTIPGKQLLPPNSYRITGHVPIRRTCIL